MSKILRLALATAGALSAMALAGPAMAASPYPFDASQPNITQMLAPPQVLLTDVFPSSVDLASLGVSNTDLATVGPQNTPTTPGSGNLLIVGHNPLTCPNEQFPTIQSAVTAAQPGAMIKVCPGLYAEQVEIPASADGITLFSEGYLQAVIQAPPAMLSPKAIVHVNGAHNVTIRHFTITGPGDGPCDSLEYGVRVDNGGSAIITDNHITQIRDTPFSGCQNGVGVLIGRNRDNTYGSGTVVHNLIDFYQKGGIVIDGAQAQSSHADIEFNEVDGIGPTAAIAQNGIQVSRSAVADVEHNVVRDNVYLPATTVSEGILLYNELSFSQVGGTSVSYNKSFHNDDGVDATNAVDDTISHNDAYENTYDGVYADSDSANNLIAYNRLTNNGLFDCEDDSAGPYNAPGLVANRWVNDLGYTENRPGLCKHAVVP